MSSQDARQRTILWLNTYLNNANLLWDNGSTPASFICCYTMPTYYPVMLVFGSPNNIDLIFSVKEPTTKPIFNGDHGLYGFVESVPIICSAIDKAGLTAAKLFWQAEQELRRLARNFPVWS